MINDSGTIYGIEMLPSIKHEDALAKRTCSYQGLFDLSILTKNTNYEALGKTYTIFVCSFDYFKEGGNINTIQRLCVFA